MVRAACVAESNVPLSCELQLAAAAVCTDCGTVMGGDFNLPHVLMLVNMYSCCMFWTWSRCRLHAVTSAAGVAEHSNCGQNRPCFVAAQHKTGLRACNRYLRGLQVFDTAAGPRVDVGGMVQRERAKHARPRQHPALKADAPAIAMARKL